MQRRLMQTLLLVVAIMLPGACLCAQGKLSTDTSSRLSTIPNNPAMAKALEAPVFKMIAVQFDGWMETLPTYARLRVNEITGRTAIHGQNPVYTVLSMMYQPDQWETARILPVEHPRLLDELKLDGKWVSPKQVRESPGLKPLMAELQAADQREGELRRTRKLLNVVEQARRMGSEPRVVEQYENDPKDPIPASEVMTLLEDADSLRATHERRRELEEKVNAEKAFKAAGNHLLDRVMVLDQVRDGFLIMPDSESPVERWTLPSELGDSAPKLAEAGRTFETKLASAFLQNDPSELQAAATSFLDTVQLSRLYPSTEFRRAENWYVLNNPWRVAAWFYLAASCLYGLFFFFGTQKFYWPSIALAGAGFLFHTSAVALRLYLKGHMPVSNMFEAITFCSWAIMLIAMVWELINRKGLVGVGSTILSFLLLTAASLMPLHDTRIHPLRAVLNSYWLNIHVTMMLISYAAFSISAFFALVYIVRTLTFRQARVTGVVGLIGGAFFLGGYHLLRNVEGTLHLPGAWASAAISAIEIGAFLAGWMLVAAGAIAVLGFGVHSLLGRIAEGRETNFMTLEQNEQFAYRLVQLGWPILTLGVMLGAVWANTAWGRFWGWDPKETWAFITWVAYTVYLHVRMVMGWRGRMSAAACLVGFVMVLITWLGVSYLPWFSGGLHSYASPT